MGGGGNSGSRTLCPWGGGRRRGQRGERGREAPSSRRKANTHTYTHKLTFPYLQTGKRGRESRVQNAPHVMHQCTYAPCVHLQVQNLHNNSPFKRKINACMSMCLRLAMTMSLGNFASSRKRDNNKKSACFYGAQSAKLLQVHLGR